MWGECSSPDDFAAMIERAVLANAGGQGPVCEVVQDNQDRYLSLACVGAVKPKVGDKLYAHPLPAQAIPEGLIDALEQSQYQIDADGTFIGVSRQALCEAIDIIKSLSAPQKP